jgi:predicted Zn finger-like uncharacterized protein
VKIEVRCTACGRGYLVDEAKLPAAGGFVPCQSCGATIALKPLRVEAPAAAAGGAARSSTAPSRHEVCCPRCGMHFTPAGEPERTSRPTVLIVEDMDYFTEIARDALGGRYELKCAKTVAEARGLLAGGRIDLLLLDLTLEGGQDGLRLLREPPGKTCPVLLFTAQDESDMYGDSWTRLQALGADDVVIKGMNMGESLTRKVAALLGEALPQDGVQR